jgi:hypothetical protein
MRAANLCGVRSDANPPYGHWRAAQLGSQDASHHRARKESTRLGSLSLVAFCSCAHAPRVADELTFCGPMKIFITSVAEKATLAHYDFPNAYLPRGGEAKYPITLVESPEEADIIIFWMFYEDSQTELVPRLRSSRLVDLHAEKCFVVSTEDNPVPFFPGVYTSLSRSNHSCFRHRAGCYGISMNRFVAQYASKPQASPSFLASFAGSLSHPVRASILADSKLKASCLLRSVPLFSFTTDTGAPEKAAGQELYAKQMADGKFSLCPRGVGPGTHRVFESMEMSRCPVVLGDQWVPPDGPAWQDCSIRVAERHVKHLHSILSEHESRWEILGRNARLEWEKWFGPEVFAQRTIQSVVDIYYMRTQDERTFRKNWKWLLLRHRAGSSKLNRGLQRGRRLASRLHAKIARSK